MTGANPITGKPQVEQFKGLANCLRDILCELPDSGDIAEALNVAVKLDRMLALVQAFPTSAELEGVVAASQELLQKLTALETARAADKVAVLAALESVSSAIARTLGAMNTGLEGRIAEAQTAIISCINAARDKVIADLGAKIDAHEAARASDHAEVLAGQEEIMMALSASGLSRFFQDYETFRNEEWVLIGGPLLDVATEASVKMRGANETLLVKFGLADGPNKKVTPISEDVEVKLNTTVLHRLPRNLAKGKHLMMLGRRTDADAFDTPSTAFRTRVNTQFTKWGGHVKCYADHGRDGVFDYAWQGGPSTARLTDISARADSDRFVGFDDFDLCFPVEPISDVKYVRCKVTFTPNERSQRQATAYSPTVRLVETDIPVTAAVYS